MNAVSNYTHVSVWNMNGGPIPADVLDSIEEAVEGILKDAEKKHNVRLLYSVVTNDPVGVA